MAVMPGAVWRPITVPGGHATRTPGRGVILHVAASEATSLYGFFNGNTSANSHFYVAKDGTIEQYIDTAYQSWTSMTANKNTIGVESQGGVNGPDTEPWTAAQVNSLAAICRWANETEGVPLALMPNSLPASKGIGYHRLGIDPWRISGGEVWSSSTGKVCPGTAKIAQIPGIIQLAQEDNMPLTDADAAVLWNHVLGQSNGLGPAPASIWLQNALFHATSADNQLTGTAPASHTLNADVRNDLANKAKQLQAILDGLDKVQAPTVDPGALADALVANKAAVATLADALAAAIATRLAS